MENRKGIWGERDDSFLTSWRCLPGGAVGKGLPEFPRPGHSLHCCTSSESGGPGGLCFSSCSSSPCSFWPSSLGADLRGRQSYCLGSSVGERSGTKASLETEVSSLVLHFSTCLQKRQGFTLSLSVAPFQPLLQREVWFVTHTKAINPSARSDYFWRGWSDEQSGTRSQAFWRAYYKHERSLLILTA